MTITRGAAFVAVFMGFLGCGGGPAPADSGVIKAQGEACSAAQQCASGFCVSGVCCSASCEGACQACTAALTGSADGTCAPKRDGVVCRASAGPCDVEETCAAGECPADAFAGAATSCRASAGLCDLEEKCSGASASCPVDVKRAAQTVCRAAAGVCDAEDTCDGVGSDCPDTFLPATTECRAATGVCDAPESCTGSTATCPADVALPQGSVCRPGAGACDLPEVCDGVGDSCPADTLASAGTSCRAAAGACDTEEVCTGAQSECPPDVFAANTVICRAAVGVCDLAETCSGTGAACPADAKQPSTQTCRPANGACDVAELCTGTGDQCPAEQLASAGTVCRAAAGTCDRPEVCDGQGAGCPADTVFPANTPGLCGTYRCTGTTTFCSTTCSINADCAGDATSYCRAGQCVTGRVVFVTSTSYTPDFGSLAAAQAACTSHAADAGLSGRFDAWLSSSDGGSPQTRFNRDGGAWIRRDKLVLATDWADLTTGPTFPQVAVGYDERGTVVPAGTRKMWTGTGTLGEPQGVGASSFCNDWTLNNPTSPVIYVGFCDSNTSSWTQTGGGCNGSGRLYCFEQ